MANACFSRGKRIIHPNLKVDDISEEPAKAIFVIDEGGESTPVPYVDNLDSDARLKRFAVFDNQSVPIQLDKSNTVQFIPGQLSVFDKVNEYIYAIEEILKSETNTLRMVNPVENSFADTTSIVSRTLLNLPSDFTDEQIKELTTFPENGEELIKQLKAKREALKKLDIPEKIERLAEEQKTLSDYKLELETLIDNFSDAKVAEINTQITEVVEKKALVEKLGVEKFDDGIFATTGSEHWKSLLIAAKKLYDKELDATNSKEIESCLLCHQDLGDGEKQLFNDYWAFLGSNAEEELKTATKKLKIYQEALKTLKLKLPKTDDKQPAIKLLLQSNVDFVT